MALWHSHGPEDVVHVNLEFSPEDMAASDHTGLPFYLCTYEATLKVYLYGRVRNVEIPRGITIYREPCVIM